MLVVFLATAAVRLPGLLSRAIWYDEAVTLLETAVTLRPLGLPHQYSLASPRKIWQGRRV